MLKDNLNPQPFGMAADQISTALPNSSPVQLFLARLAVTVGLSNLVYVRITRSLL